MEVRKLMPFYESPRNMPRVLAIFVLMWFIAGVMFLIGAITEFDPLPSISKEPLVEMVLGLFFTAGSVLALAAMYPWRRESTAWALELGAWPVLASAWALYAVFALLNGPWALQAVLASGGAFACIHRFTEVMLVTRRTRKNVENYKTNVLGE